MPQYGIAIERSSETGTGQPGCQDSFTEPGGSLEIWAEKVVGIGVGVGATAGAALAVGGLAVLASAAALPEVRPHPVVAIDAASNMLVTVRTRRIPTGYATDASAPWQADANVLFDYGGLETTETGPSA
jgi:hypothetical protein